MSAITTHVLDTSAGLPGVGIPVVLERKTDDVGWQTIADGITDSDGRARNLLPADEALLPGHYRLVFDTAAYFVTRNIECFFPLVTVGFLVKDPAQHYHVPLLLSPFGYSTYRGT